MNNQRIAQLYRELANEFEKGVAPSNPPNHPIPTEPEPNPQPEPTGKYEVLISFMENSHNWIGETVDVWLNGQKFAFRGKGKDDPIWTQKLHDSRGVVVTLDKPLTLIEFDPNQIKRQGDPHHGFGTFVYKIMGAPTYQKDLTKIVDAPANDPYYWATAHDKDQAVQVSRQGENGNPFDHKYFYRREIPASWGVTGKYKLFIARDDLNPNR